MTSSKGIVLFAYNTEFDYVKIANISARLANKFAGVPITLITDTFGALQADQTIIDNVIIHSTEDESNKRTVITDYNGTTKRVTWKNLTRADVYELSPYDQTLLIDCDYLMFNDNLNCLFETEIEFTCYKEAYDVTGLKGLKGQERISRYSIPHLWATVIYFRKTEFSKSVFDMMKLVQENYHYYSKVYGFKPAPFRNDFALSIAYHSLAGYGLDELLPYKLPSLTSMTDVIEFRPNGELLYQYKKDGRLYTGIAGGMDLHIMNKLAFTDEFIERVLDYAA